MIVFCGHELNLLWMIQWKSYQMWITSHHFMQLNLLCCWIWSYQIPFHQVSVVKLPKKNCLSHWLFQFWKHNPTYQPLSQYCAWPFLILEWSWVCFYTNPYQTTNLVFTIVMNLNVFPTIPIDYFYLESLMNMVFPTSQVFLPTFCCSIPLNYSSLLWLKCFGIWNIENNSVVWCQWCTPC